MTSEIKINVVGLIYNNNLAGTYGLIMAEEDGKRRFSVMIGEPEAQSIAMKMNKKKSPRPLTHDLIISLLASFNAKLKKIVICDMINEVFYSELYIERDNNQMVVDARTSDAIALAIRSECDIFIKSEVLNIVGIEVEPKANEETLKEEDTINVNAEELSHEDLDLLSVEDLEELLSMAVKEEKYELAVNLRDAIKRRKKV
jgi:bifunctional DNase/RNase